VTARPGYLAVNRDLARRFLGQRLTRMVRFVAALEPDESARSGPSDALLESERGDQWLISNDAALGNVVLVDAVSAADALRWLKELYPVEVPLAGPGPGDPLGFLLGAEIASVEVASRRDVEDEPRDAFTMCGVRLTVQAGGTVCFGTYLTTLRQPELGFYLPEELDPALAFGALGMAEESG
jgi:hypothetical protein